jgi:hypothetical protein
MTTIILIVIAGILDAFYDLLFHQKVLSRSEYWNPLLSWKRKWKNGDRAQGERFFGSSTIFVMFIDGIHLVKLFLFGILIYAIVSAGQKDYELIETILFLAIFLISSELSYRIGDRKVHKPSYTDTNDNWIEYAEDFELEKDYTYKNNALRWKGNNVVTDTVVRQVVEEDLGSNSVQISYNFKDKYGNNIPDKDIISFKE